MSEPTIDLPAVEVCDGSESCGDDLCQACCPHNERDHGICLDCGDEEDPGAAIDRAMDYWEGER